MQKVTYLTAKKEAFSDSYIAIRSKENRVLTDDEVRQLPYTAASNPNANEWKVRQHSSKRFLDYLSNKKDSLHVLDIGCGNGWFSHLMSQIPNTTVVGLDINAIELEQAATVFDAPNLTFVYGDIFEIITFQNQFHIITLNACVQYFPNFDTLIHRLKTFLLPHGEIHIIDSPFYTIENLADAQKRSIAYYTNLGFPEMANYYYHHSIEAISEFDILYQPPKNKISKWLSVDYSPFMWLKYSKKL